MPEKKRYKCPYCDAVVTKKGMNMHMGRKHKDMIARTPDPIVEAPPSILPKEAKTSNEQTVVETMAPVKIEKDEIVVMPSQNAGDGEHSYVPPQAVESSSNGNSQPQAVHDPSSAPSLKSNDAKLQNNSRLAKLFQRKPKERKIVSPMEKPKEAPKVSDTAILQKRKPMEKDPEGLISLLLSIPTWLLVIGIPAFLLLNLNKIIDFFTYNDIGILLVYVVTHPKETASVIILVMIALVVISAIVIFYKLIWRMAFKDLDIKYAEPRFMAHSDVDDDTEIIGGARKVFLPQSYEGRIYASIGFGFWDRLYRKRFNVEKPEIITLFVHRRWTPVNPFKPLSSCDKFYINDPDGSRFYKNGRFRLNASATRILRDSEEGAICYWLDEGGYPQEKFNSIWYQGIHNRMLDKGLKKVSKGSLVNPDIQQDQMRRNMLWLQPQDIEEEKRLIQLKEKKGGQK